MNEDWNDDTPGASRYPKVFCHIVGLTYREELAGNVWLCHPLVTPLRCSRVIELVGMPRGHVFMYRLVYVGASLRCSRLVTKHCDMYIAASQFALGLGKQAAVYEVYRLVDVLRDSAEHPKTYRTPFACHRLR